MRDKDIDRLEKVAEKFIIGFRKLTKKQRQLIKYRDLAQRKIQEHEIRINELEKLIKGINSELVSEAKK